MSDCVYVWAWARAWLQESAIRLRVTKLAMTGRDMRRPWYVSNSSTYPLGAGYVSTGHRLQTTGVFQIMYSLALVLLLTSLLVASNMQINKRHRYPLPDSLSMGQARQQPTTDERSPLVSSSVERRASWLYLLYISIIDYRFDRLLAIASLLCDRSSETINIIIELLHDAIWMCSTKLSIRLAASSLMRPFIDEQWMAEPDKGANSD